MKKVLLVALALVSFSSLFSQNIQIVRADNHHVVNDSLIQINGTVASTELTTMPLWVINNTGLSITLKCKWEDSTAITGAWQKICWGLCYGDQQAMTWTAPSSQTVAGHDTNSTFAGYLDDTGHLGCAVVRYVWYSASNPADSVWVLVKYCINPLGVEQIQQNAMHISAPYPNPSGNNVSFNYHISNTARLSLFNTLGQSVKEATLSATDNKLVLNVSNLPSGIYICKFESAGAAPIFQKLIVTH